MDIETAKKFRDDLHNLLWGLYLGDWEWSEDGLVALTKQYLQHEERNCVKKQVKKNSISEAKEAE